MESHDPGIYKAVYILDSGMLIWELMWFLNVGRRASGVDDHALQAGRLSLNTDRYHSTSAFFIH